jgi:hypothetical protein
MIIHAVNIQFAAIYRGVKSTNELAITQCTAQLATNSDVHRIKVHSAIMHSDAGVFCSGNCHFSCQSKAKPAREKFVLRVLLLCRRFSQCERRKNNFLGALWKPSLIKANVRRHQSQRRKWSQLPPSRSLCVCVFFPRVFTNSFEHKRGIRATPSSYLSTNISSLATEK